MTRRRNPTGAPSLVDPADAPEAPANAAIYHDAFVSRYAEWMRQVERIESTSLAGLGTLLQNVAARAASARTWAEWAALAGAGMQEAFDDMARTQGECLSALMQCQMEAVKMLLDLGRPALPASHGADPDFAAAWFAPWMAGAGIRPVQIA
jgi:hypothetical protein